MPVYVILTLKIWKLWGEDASSALHAAVVLQTKLDMLKAKSLCRHTAACDRAWSSASQEENIFGSGHPRLDWQYHVFHACQLTVKRQLGNYFRQVSALPILCCSWSNITGCLSGQQQNFSWKAYVSRLCFIFKFSDNRLHAQIGTHMPDCLCRLILGVRLCVSGASGPFATCARTIWTSRGI